ncbi:MAG: acyl--CoA ligase [Spirochaetes bacterium]|uniref:Acyl--CoA ligase n=1 Tax=Candidatus Ornithospirochaeta stercoripullorum TaxID=2840899 RepID=A0A9D9DZD2_9SPIO|nr:acyl--CoA ligase [Candidatus Ornithospirochaeta stercoripullorum]
MKFTPTQPWRFLDEFRGKEFTGQWPNIKEMFHISCLRYPNNLCFRAFSPKEERFTYAEAEKKIKEVSYFLLAEGAKKGDKIGVSGKNSPEWAIAYLGVIYAGCIVVPLDYSLKDNEMEHLISFGGVSRLFIDKERIEHIDADGSAGLIAKYCLERDESHPFVLDMNGPEREGWECASDETAAILFTSGTTGTPKGVMLSHNNLVSDCYLAQGNMNIYSTDVFYAILPIHHAYTMLAVFFESFSVGAATVFGKKLVVSQILKELKEGHVTMFLAVPMLFNKMVGALMAGVRKKGAVVYALIRAMMGFSGFVKKLTGVNIGKKMFGFLLRQLSLEDNRICICGGGPLPASTFRMFNELGIDFVQGYGLTETSPITHLNPTEAYIETSVGRKIPGCEVKIVDPDSDGNGTIYIKGSMVMQGYYNNQEATDEVLSPDGWLNTGDVGHEDADGYLYLTGRAKSVIVTDGGKNVFPEEVEDHFQLYDDIDQVCVIGYLIDKAMKSEGIRVLIYPAKKYADSVDNNKAVIEKHMNEIVDQVNRELQSYKKITKVTVVDAPMPMTSTKKIKRFEVKAMYD